MTIRTFCWLISSVILFTGCGGGGGGGGGNESSLSRSSESSASSSSVSTAILSIEGRLASQKLANGRVTATIGNQEFITEADGQQNFTLRLPSSVSNLNSPVLLKANGISIGSKVEYAALLPSVNKLLSIAGDDKILKTAEYAGTTLNAFTTAEYALMQHSLLPTRTDEERDSALGMMFVSPVSEMAALLHHYENQETLPRGFNTGLQLLLDKPVATAYMNILRSKKGLTESSARLRENAVQSPTLQDIEAGRYMLRDNNTNRVLVFNFETNGSGSIESAPILLNASYERQRQLTLPFEWQLNGNRVSLTFEPIYLSKENENYLLVEGQDNVFLCELDETSFKDTCRYLLTNIEMTINNQNENGYYVEVSPNIAISRNGAIVNDRFLLLKIDGLLMAENQFIPFTPSMLVGYQWYMGKYSFNLYADGNAVLKNQLENTTNLFTWEIDGNKLSLYRQGSRILGRGMQLLAFNKKDVGFGVALYDPDEYNLGLIRSIEMIKREPITFQDTDWIGNWVQNSYFSQINPQGDWRDGYHQNNRGSWEIKSPSIIRLNSNNAWYTDRELLNKDQDFFYFNDCIKDSYFQYCYPLKAQKLSEKAVYWWPESPLVATNQSTGELWLFDDKDILVANGTELNKRSYDYVSESHYFFPNTNTILELLKSSNDKFTVCEYPIESACEYGTQYELSLGVELNVQQSSLNGKVYLRSLNGISYEKYPLEKSILLPKSTHQVLLFEPNDGYILNGSTVRGCNGVLIDMEYHIPPLAENCEVVVDFKRVN